MIERAARAHPSNDKKATYMSALAIGELVKQTFGDLGGSVEMGEMAVREEARGLLLPTAIFTRWSTSEMP